MMESDKVQQRELQLSPQPKYSFVGHKESNKTGERPQSIVSNLSLMFDSMVLDQKSRPQALNITKEFGAQLIPSKDSTTKTAINSKVSTLIANFNKMYSPKAAVMQKSTSATAAHSRSMENFQKCFKPIKSLKLANSSSSIDKISYIPPKLSNNTPFLLTDSHKLSSTANNNNQCTTSSENNEAYSQTKVKSLNDLHRLKKVSTSQDGNMYDSGPSATNKSFKQSGTLRKLLQTPDTTIDEPSLINNSIKVSLPSDCIFTKHNCSDALIPSLVKKGPRQSSAMGKEEKLAEKDDMVDDMTDKLSPVFSSFKELPKTLLWETKLSNSTDRPTMVKDRINMFENNLRLPNVQAMSQGRVSQTPLCSITKVRIFANQESMLRSEINVLGGVPKDIISVVSGEEGNKDGAVPTKISTEDIFKISTDKGNGESKSLFSNKGTTIDNSMSKSTASVNKVKDMVTKLEKNSALADEASPFVCKSKSITKLPLTDISRKIDKKNFYKSSKSKENLVVALEESDNSIKRSFKCPKNQTVSQLEDKQMSPLKTEVPLLEWLDPNCSVSKSAPKHEYHYINPDTVLECSCFEENIYEEILPPIADDDSSVKDLFGEVKNDEHKRDMIPTVNLADRVAAEKASMLINEDVITFCNQDRWSFSSEGIPCELEARNNSLYEMYSSRSSQVSNDSDSIEEATFSEQFNDEPLYQIYFSSSSKTFNDSGDYDQDIYEDIDDFDSKRKQFQSRPMVNEILQQIGGFRTLWCQIPEVIERKLFENLSPNERKLQEIKFEVMMSEASYLKSLDILVSHFMKSKSLNDETVLSNRDKAILFSNITSVKTCSEWFLKDIERCWEDDIFLEGICEIICHHAKNYFEVYITYCSNQVYQDSLWKRLLKSDKFLKEIKKIQSEPICQKQSLHSFLILPMQRITRIRLLVQSIYSLHSTDDPKWNSWKEASNILNDVVEKCNEGARNYERIQEMEVISQQLDFKEVEALPLLTGDRWLLKKGELVHLLLPYNASGVVGISSTVKALPSSPKISIGRKIFKQPLSIFLFTDLLVITKKQSEERFLVIDYSPRILVTVVDEDSDDLKKLSQKYNLDDQKNLFIISMLENSKKEAVKMILLTSHENEKKKWLEAFAHKNSDNPSECMHDYECPEVAATHTYLAKKPRELSLEPSDVVKIICSSKDGMCYGIRAKDGKKGWCPANNFTESVQGQPNCFHQDYILNGERRKQQKKDTSTTGAIGKKKKLKTGSNVRSYGSVFKKSVSIISQPMGQMGFPNIV